MNFVLYNKYYDLIISILMIVNSITIPLVSYNELNKKKYDNDEKISRKDRFQFAIILFWMIVYLVGFIIISNKYNLSSILVLLYFLVFVIPVFTIRKKSISDLSYENKMAYIMVTMIYSIFFSTKASSIYVDTFSSLDHYIKEYMFIMFIVIKLIYFVFCVIINSSILMDNIKKVFNKRINSIKVIIDRYIDKTFEFGFYNFCFSRNNKNKLILVIDYVIYFITCPFLIIYNLVVPFFIKVSKLLLKLLIRIGNKIVHYLDNSSTVIRKTIQISAIISLLITYWIIVYHSDIISSNTKDVYNFISTVILIPLIYDSIKAKHEIDKKR